MKQQQKYDVKATNRQRIIASILVVLIIIATVLTIKLYKSPREKAILLSNKALMATVDNPSTVQITNISRVDSVFGREYITPQERLMFSINMMKLHKKMMKETNGLEDLLTKNRQATEMMHRQMSAMATLRSLMPMEEPHAGAPKSFNGWKVKITYQAKSPLGKSYRSQHWFILDKDAKFVIKSFEVPMV